MKLTRVLSGIFSFLALTSLVGCQDFGGVEFGYVLLSPDNNGDGIVDAAPNCAAAGVDSVRFSIGNDNNNDGILDAEEAIVQITLGCNQNDNNNNGVLDADELGSFQSNVDDIPEGFFDSFAIEFLDAGGIPVPWQTFDNNQNFDKFTFKGAEDTFVGNFASTVLPFQGDGVANNGNGLDDPTIPDQLDGELQTFIGF
jgi:hypothetical protein